MKMASDILSKKFPIFETGNFKKWSMLVTQHTLKIIRNVQKNKW